MDKVGLLAGQRARYTIVNRRVRMAMYRVDDRQVYATQTDVQTIVQVVVIVTNVSRAPISFPPCLLSILPTSGAPV